MIVCKHYDMDVVLDQTKLLCVYTGDIRLTVVEFNLWKLYPKFY